MSSDYKPWYVSPSKFGTYVDCPAQYYERYVLKKKDPEKAQQEPAAILDSGKLVHRALEMAALERIRTNTRDKKVTKKELLAHLEAATKELPKEEWQSPNQCTPEIVESAVKVIGLCWKTMSFAHTIAVEKSFSVSIGTVEDARGRVVIKDAGLSGVIDRIDDVGGRITIVDYKSGWSVLSRAEAEMDPQVNYYLAVGSILYPDRPIAFELRYLNRGIKVGPIHYTPERREWLVNKYVKPILCRMATWDRYPETPGAPQCYSCHRKAVCVSFTKMLKGSLAPMSAELTLDDKVHTARVGRALALYSRLTEIEGNAERAKKPLKEYLNALCSKASDGEIFGGDYRGRLSFRNKTEYPELRRTAVAAAKAILASRAPTPPVSAEPPSDPEELKKAYAAMVERNARLEGAALEAATAFEVACKIGKAQAGLVDDFVEALPEEITLPVSQAIDGTSSNSGYYSLDVEKLAIPFQDPEPSKAERELADAQAAERKLLGLGAVPLLEDPGIPREDQAAMPAITGGAGGSTSGNGQAPVVATVSVAPAAPSTPTKTPAPAPVASAPVATEAPKPEDEAKKPSGGLLFPDADKPAWAQPDCVGCGGTGINSKGGPCSPCVNTAARKATAKVGASA